MTSCHSEVFYSGQNILTQGMYEDTFVIMRRGKADVLINDEDGQPERVKSVYAGEPLGEMALMYGTRRSATVQAAGPCEVFILDRAAYDTGLAILAPEDRVGPLLKIKHKFWELCTGPDGSRRPEVDFKCYLKYHSRVTRTLSGNDDDLEACSEDEQREIALEDWTDDTERHEVKMTGALSLNMFFDSLHELVHAWAGDMGAALSYTQFLDIIFDNIAHWVVDPDENGGKGYWAFKDLDQVGAQGDELEALQDAARKTIEDDDQANKDALVNAERMRLEQELSDREKRERMQLANEERRRQQERDAKMKGWLDRLAALRREQVLIRRELANSILSPFEEETLRQRLAQIPQDIIEIKIEMVEYDEMELVRKMGAGEVAQREEEESMRKLMADCTRQKLELKLSGLSTEKEEVMRRLGKVLDRAALVRLHRTLTLEDEEALHNKAMLAPRDLFGLELRLPDIDGKDRPMITLALLEMELDELNRRMASGMLSPAQDAEAQRRAAQIVLTERKGPLDELSRQITVARGLRRMEKTRNMYRCHSRTPRGEPHPDLVVAPEKKGKITNRMLAITHFL